MLNKKPMGPEVVVRVFYDPNQVFQFPATDDHREFVGLKPDEQAAKILRATLKQIEEDLAARPAALALLQKKG